MYVAASYPATSITSSCFILYTAAIQDSRPLGKRLDRLCTPFAALGPACAGVQA